MTKSRVKLDWWVEPTTCCIELNDSSKFKNLAAKVLLVLITWKLKLPRIIKYPGDIKISLRKVENSPKNISGVRCFFVEGGG